MKTGNTGRYLLPYWEIVRNDKKNSGKKETLLNQQKQIHQREIVERRVYLLLVQHSHI